MMQRQKRAGRGFVLAALPPPGGSGLSHMLSRRHPDRLPCLGPFQPRECLKGLSESVFLMKSKHEHPPFWFNRMEGQGVHASSAATPHLNPKTSTHGHDKK